MDPQDYFASDEYSDFRSLGQLVFQTVHDQCDFFLGVVRGTRPGVDIGHPDIERGLCFPKRFLKVSSTEALPTESRLAVEQVLDDTFYLGLTCYLLLNSFPTRSQVTTVDVERLLLGWAHFALVANHKMRAYNKDLNELPSRMFEAFFRSTAQPDLESHVKLGFWKRSQVHSFLTNLFFSGAQLGMHTDLAIR